VRDVCTCQSPPPASGRGSIPATAGPAGPSRIHPGTPCSDDPGIVVGDAGAGDRPAGRRRRGHRPRRDPRVRPARARRAGPSVGGRGPRRISDDDVAFIPAMARMRPKKLGLPNAANASASAANANNAGAVRGRKQPDPSHSPSSLAPPWHIDPAIQQRLATRCATILSWATSHSPFCSRPELVVDLLTDLVRRQPTTI
jgi:hypothetical protein